MVKKSIRLRITLIFIAITAALIFAMFLLNRFFLAPFYLNEKVKTLEEAYNSLNGLMTGADGNGTDFSEIVSGDFHDKDNEWISLIRRYTDRSNMDIVIIDTRDNSAIGISREKDWLINKLRAYNEFSDAFKDGRLPDSKYRMIRREDRYVIQMNFDPRTGTSNLECWGTLADPEYMFLMILPVESITESTEIMERFIIAVGLVLLILGSVIIYIATSYITKPINELAAISANMSELDFSEKYKGNREDEIGVLGNSMNSMSGRLEKTIADLKTANAELQEANRRLQEDIDLKEKTDTMRKEFISNVSHELKTPIALIEGYAEGLSEGIAEDPESRKYYCNVIMDEAGKMNSMVKQLTSLTQYEFGESVLSIEEFDLSELLKNEVEKEKLCLEEKKAAVILNIPEKCIVKADEFKIEEVVTNFLTNAINHLGGKRRIIVSVTDDSPGIVRLSVYNDGEHIPEESLPLIWEKFYKVDRARTRAYGGSGIGLSIVKAIALAHHQEYGVINKDSGVEFYINLDAVNQV